MSRSWRDNGDISFIDFLHLMEGDDDDYLRSRGLARHTSLRVLTGGRRSYFLFACTDTGSSRWHKLRRKLGTSGARSSRNTRRTTGHPGISTPSPRGASATCSGSYPPCGNLDENSAWSGTRPRKTFARGSGIASIRCRSQLRPIASATT